MCLGANCTEAEAENEVNTALANITDAINAVVGADGVECSAVISGASKMAGAFIMTSLVAIVSYSLF